MSVSVYSRSPSTVHPQWDVAKAAVKSFDLQGKTVGSLGGGAIATHVMRRLKVRAASRNQARCVWVSVLLLVPQMHAG